MERTGPRGIGSFVMRGPRVPRRDPDRAWNADCARAARRDELRTPEDVGLPKRTNVPKKHAGGEAGKDLASLSKRDLLERARTLDIAGRSTMAKKDLIEAIRKAA